MEAIAEVTGAAFRTLEISNHTEQFIVAPLRTSKPLAVSLPHGRVTFHDAFTADH